MAGSYSITTKYCKVNDQLNPLKVLEISLTADAADGSFPSVLFDTGFGGILMDVSVVFDGTTPPNALTWSLKDAYGLVIASGTSITASTSRGVLDSNMPTRGGSLVCTGNSTNSAKVKVVLYVL